jgi:hypothetical protein
VKSGVNHISRRVIGLSKFHDILSPIILHFDGNISDGSLHSEISLIAVAAAGFSSFGFFIIAYSCVLVKALSW